LLETVDADSLRQGTVPKPRTLRQSALRAIPEPTPVLVATAEPTAIADPSTVRPSLALAAAENVDHLTASLLEAAGSAVKPVG
jgi:hypothetical protein